MDSAENRITLNRLKQLFQKSADVQFQVYTFHQKQVVFITCDAMIDKQQLTETVIPSLERTFEETDDEKTGKSFINKMHLPNLKIVDTEEEIITLVFSGQLLLYFIETELLYASDISKKPNRQPEETKLGVPVKGPRDNFIEDIAVNIALIRKRLPTNSLCVEKFELGSRSKTAIALLYFDDIASKEILYAIKKRLKKVDTDIIFSGDILMERMEKRSKLFPFNDSTGRADNVMQALVRGRFVILVDGVAYAVITPVDLFLLLKTSDDFETPSIFSSLERVLRLGGMVVGLLLPAFWLALTTFHQNQLPLQLLATVVQANTGLPLPSALEMLIMLIMFELFREAGLRLPTALGGTIGVVGGLIIGDAAIRAGITSPAMIVIIAASTIAAFTLVNQSLAMAVSVLRIVFILLTSFLGLFGFFMCIYFTILYLSNIRIFGVPYISITTNPSWSTIKKALFRLSPSQDSERPEQLKTKDNTRSKEAGK